MKTNVSFSTHEAGKFGIRYGWSGESVRQMIMRNPFFELERARTVEEAGLALCCIKSTNGLDVGLIEQVLLELNKQERGGNMVEEIVDWCLCGGGFEKRSARVRLFRFLFNAKAPNPEYSLANVNCCRREVNKAVRKDPALYWAHPGYLKLLEYHLTTAEKCAPDFSTIHWDATETAIRRIVQVGDLAYLPQIRKYRDNYAGGEWSLRHFPELGEDSYEPGRIGAFLNDSVTFLEEAAEEQGFDKGKLLHVSATPETRSVMLGLGEVSLLFQEAEGVCKITVHTEDEEAKGILSQVLDKSNVDVQIDGAWPPDGEPTLAPIVYPPFTAKSLAFEATNEGLVANIPFHPLGSRYRVWLNWAFENTNTTIVWYVG